MVLLCWMSEYVYDWCVSFANRRPFYDKRMSTEVEADFLGDEWKVKHS